MALYELHKVEKKRIVVSLGHAHAWDDAISEAEGYIEAGEANEVWITDPVNITNVFAVVTKDGWYTE